MKRNQTDAFRGVFAIALTPFDCDGNILWDDFVRECDWMVRCGSHGLVWPVMASEFTVLSFGEWVEGMRLAVDAVQSRIPVVIGVADTSRTGALRFAEEAADAGADAIIAMPPWATKMSGLDLIEDYYRTLASATGLPVFVQNCGPPLGSNLPGQFVVELCERIPLVQYVKEEREPPGQAISEVLGLAGPGVLGVFSGSACLWILGDYRRGAAGSMPSAILADLDSQIWDLLEVGDEKRACQIHDAKLVLENVLRGMPILGARKYLMVRRGVFSCTGVRNVRVTKLDDVDLLEIERGLKVVEPYLRV